jgi:hypothetical protein
MTLTLAKNPIIVGEVVLATVTVADTQPDGTKFFPSGTVTVGTGAVTGSCTLAPTATEGIASCATPLSAGAAGIYPLTATFTATTIHAGSTSPTVTLTVFSFYNFTGFLSPLTIAGTLTSPTLSGTANNGSAVPLKWQLRDSSGSFLTALSTTQLIQAVAYTGGGCSGQATGQTLLLYSPTNGATGGSTFRYDTTNNQFIFNWDTSSAFGPGCYEVLLTLADGSPVKATTVKLQ